MGSEASRRKHGRRPRDEASGRSDVGATTRERGSNDGSASRLSSLREIFDFPLAVRTLRVLPTLPDDVRQAARIRRILAPSRESEALSNDSEAQPASGRGRSETPSSPSTCATSPN